LTIQPKLILALAALALSSQAASPPIVLKAARMFDGKSDHLVTPGLVVVADGKIFRVGAGATVPPDAVTYDLGDATLLPGFIDAHTHLSMIYSDDWKQNTLDSLEKPITELTLDAIPNLKVTLMAGFTTVRDVGSSDYIDVGLRNAVRDGIIVGPRMLVCVHAIGSTGGHCDTTGFRAGLFGRETDPTDGVINSPDEARRAVRLNVK
jgi:imidazolonepropionase-like amidohydrolase